MTLGFAQMAIALNVQRKDTIFLVLNWNNINSHTNSKDRLKGFETDLAGVFLVFRSSSFTLEICPRSAALNVLVHATVIVTPRRRWENRLRHSLASTESV